MSNVTDLHSRITPALMPVGDAGLLVKFSNSLNDVSNAAAVSLARRLKNMPMDGVLEIVPSLVSVLLRYDPVQIGFSELASAVRLMLTESGDAIATAPDSFSIEVSFGGSSGPDLGEAARLCGLSDQQFIAAHNQSSLRVLATGFAPGFVYCGLHPHELNVPRRGSLHERVPAGSILFAAGQTSIMATDGPTGWHVIGRTDFRNFDATRDPPTTLKAGDQIRFLSVS